jgi:hypothetical protein
MGFYTSELWVIAQDGLPWVPLIADDLARSQNSTLEIVRSQSRAIYQIFNGQTDNSPW